MRDFLKLFALFMFLPLVVFVIGLYSADGRTNPFYLRFTTPRQGSLIVGDSRSAQGIHPQVLDSTLHAGEWAGNTFNYSFALNESNFGRAYYESIRKKLDPSSRDGVFIVSVDPWNISRSKNRTEEEEEQQEEQRSLVARMRFVNMYPNVEYLLTEYPKPFLTLLFPLGGKRNKEMNLHKNGWLEVDIDLTPEVVEKRIEGKIQYYLDNHVSVDTLSSERITYLGKTIDLLKQHGTVLVVRLPTHSAMHALEESYMPDFNRLIERIAHSKEVPYLVITPDDDTWKFTDGNHMTPASGAKVSGIIGEELLKHMRK